MQREQIDVDVLCVGAGVASLSAVLRLLRRTAPAKPTVMILEKGKHVGAHVLSGAVVDPAPLRELLTEEELAAMPVAAHVRQERFYRLTRRHALRLPFLPPALRAKGYPIVSLGALCKYLAALCEQAGAEIYTEMAAAEVLEENGTVVGVRVGDKGLDKDGQPTDRCEPGPEIRARVTILGEGACGVLTQRLIERHALAADANPQAYAVGIKEIIETPARPARAGTIVHTFGYPLDYATYGGGFVYGISPTEVALGLVVALDYRNAGLNPHEEFLKFKAHPLVRDLIRDGHVVGYGAKMLPEGGLFAVPELVTPGALIVGDGGGLLDAVRLKGIHLAMQSGIAAGDTLAEALAAGAPTPANLAGYPQRLRATSGWRQMQRVRNVRACFAWGAVPGVLAAGASLMLGGWVIPGRLRMHADHECLRKGTPATPGEKEHAPKELPEALALDRLTDVFHAGITHDEHQPCHLKIKDRARCVRECLAVYGAPCTRFCPAQVYTLADDGTEIKIDAANCLHCKTCQVKDPLQNIEWTLPEGGSGPNYPGL
ncbi:MAG: electron transfer flavoprotein-ubiquinone oxidoreductase [bacterium]|nr:electron transfer flavoprotein-ubiquinone oxidoreductase [bacterium]